jgi:tetratricopeptide (TPR) repeat protein
LGAYGDRGGGGALAAPHDRISLGELFLALGRPDEASRQYELAVLISHAIAAAQPDSLLAKNDLFLSAIGLGGVQMMLHNPANARQIARTALAAAEARAVADPKNAALRRDVARCHELTVQASVALHDLSAARAAAEQLVATVEGYAKAGANDLNSSFDLANGYIIRGGVERLDHAFDVALPWYDRALAVLRPLNAAGKLAPYPLEVTRLEEAERTARECRDTLKAVGDVNFALKERGGETSRRLLVWRAEALAHRGRTADAAATAEMVRALRPDDGANRYDVACCYALCMPVAKEPAARADYAARALEELHAAAARGYGDVGKIESDPDLDGLHGEAGYRGFITGLKARRLGLTLRVLP